MISYEAKLRHNYGELTPHERLRYEIDRVELSQSDRFFFEGSLFVLGEMYKAEREALYDTIIQYQPMHCFEVGTGSGGGSTFFLACAFLKLGRGKVITLEVAGDAPLQNYRRCFPELLPYVEFMKGGDPALFMSFIEDRVECVFLDGSDDSEETVAQYEFFRPFLKPGSILMVHDWGSEKTRRLKPIIEEDPDWSIEVQLSAPESAGLVIAHYRPNSLGVIK